MNESSFNFTWNRESWLQDIISQKLMLVLRFVMHWHETTFISQTCSFWLTFQVDSRRISWDRLGYAMVANNYKISVASSIKIYFLLRFHPLMCQQETLAHLRHLGDMPDGIATISNIASCQARKKKVLGDLISLLKTLWSGAFTIHWPKLVTWLHPTTKGSGSTADMFPEGERIRYIWQAAPMTTILNQDSSHFFFLLYKLES